MSNHIEKALLLFERRPEAAAKEVLAAIAENPNDSYLHALLALCLMNSKDPEGRRTRELRGTLRRQNEGYGSLDRQADGGAALRPAA